MQALAGDWGSNWLCWVSDRGRALAPCASARPCKAGGCSSHLPSLLVTPSANPIARSNCADPHQASETEPCTRPAAVRFVRSPGAVRLLVRRYCCHHGRYPAPQATGPMEMPPPPPPPPCRRRPALTPPPCPFCRLQPPWRCRPSISPSPCTALRRLETSTSGGYAAGLM